MGAVGAEVNAQAAAAQGMLFPPDPGSHTTATIGGNVAECSGGLRALKYGVTRDYVLGVEAAIWTETLATMHDVELMTFPRLRQLIERGEVTIHGAYFGVATGQLSVLDKETGKFRKVT